MLYNFQLMTLLCLNTALRMRAGIRVDDLPPRTEHEAVLLKEHGRGPAHQAAHPHKPGCAIRNAREAHGAWARFRYLIDYNANRRAVDSGRNHTIKENPGREGLTA